MPVVNWPPASYPTWPPAIFGGRLECSDIRALAEVLKEYGFTLDIPTPAENTQYFPNSVRCDEGHQTRGRMVVSPDGLTRWPFAVCNNAQHQQFLVLWGPDYCMGKGSEVE